MVLTTGAVGLESHIKMCGVSRVCCVPGVTLLWGKDTVGLIAETPYLISSVVCFQGPLSSLWGGALAVSFSLGVLLDFLQMPFLDLVGEGAGIMASCVVVFFLIKKKTTVKFIAVVWIWQYLKAHCVNDFVLVRTWAEVVAPLLDGS